MYYFQNNISSSLDEVKNPLLNILTPIKMHLQIMFAKGNIDFGSLGKNSKIINSLI